MMPADHCAHPRIGDFGCAEAKVMSRIASTGTVIEGTSAAEIATDAGDDDFGSTRIQMPLKPPLSVSLPSPS